MSSSWLREFVLEGLGVEIRKASQSGNETGVAASRETTGRARLVQIVGRGQGERSERDNTRNKNIRITRSNKRPSGYGWWNVSRREKSPNLAKHTDSWILVSDGSHSARVYLTVAALKDVFDWDNKNNNEDNLFGLDCCVLLKNVSFECDVDNGVPNGDSVKLKVSSLEPKPGFNYHNGFTTNRVNPSDDNSKAKTCSVMEETDVLYGLQFLAQQMRNISSGTNSGIDNNALKSACIARDWDVAFGRLSKGRLIVTSTKDGEAEGIVDTNRGLDSILKLAEEAASTDEAIREWETAKKEYGIVTFDDESNHSTRKATSTTTNKHIDGEEDVQEDNDEDEEDLSRMYIQNVLATSEDEEDERDKGKAQTSQKEYDSDNEGSLLPETQPKTQETTAATTSVKFGTIFTSSLPPMAEEIAAASGIEKQDVIKTMALKRKRASYDDDSEGLSETQLQTQPTEEGGEESGRNVVESKTKMRRKRPRVNSFESGTASNLTLDEAITASGTRKPSNQMLRRQYQQIMQHRRQERPQDSAGVWESVKEQLFEPGRKILYCVPSYRVPSGSGGMDDEKMLITPKRSLTSNSSGNVKNVGSAGSIGTNFTTSTPNPSSGAYYRKYGLARWLSQNTIDGN